MHHRKVLWAARALAWIGLFGCSDLVGQVEIAELSPADAGREGGAGSTPGDLDGCQRGDPRCQGPVLQQCVDGSGWMSIERCASAALCVAREGEISRCIEEACEPGITCAGARLQQCNVDQTGLELLDTCASPAHCDSGAGACQQAACAAGQVRCNGAALERCNDARTDVDLITTCDTAALCADLVAAHCGGNLAACDVTGAICPAPTCEQGQLRCDGTRLEICNAGRNGWDFVDECVTPGVCELTRQNPVAVNCITAPCQPGDRICSEQGAILECSVEQTGYAAEPIASCRSAAYCAPEGCQPDPCVPGTLSCNGKELTRCETTPDNSDVRRVLVADCLTPELCQATLASGPAPQACEPPECAEGEFQCAGRQMQVCNGARTAFVNVEQQLCATDALCQAGIGLGSCPAPCSGFECAGAVLRGCNAGLTAREDLENCGTPAECDSVAGRCSDPCEPGAVRCNGEVLEECRSRLEGWTRVQTCETAGLCALSVLQNQRTCEPRRCDSGQHACNGQRLEVCNAALTGFELVRTCAAGQLCDAPNEQCDVCNPNSVDCQGDVFVRCSANGQQETRTTCGAGLCSSSGANIGCLRCPQAGAFRCDNQGSLFQCSADQLSEDQVDVCRTPQLCRAGAGRCLECDPVDSSRCEGANVISCGAGNVETVASVCASAALCRTSGSTASCQASPCTVPFQCTAQGEVLACNVELTGYVAQSPPLFCASPALCDATAPTGCLPPVCAAGDLGCSGASLETCNASFTAIDQRLDTCGSPALCQEAVRTDRATCPECLPTLSECASPTELRTCAGGQIQSAACAADFTCSVAGGAAACRCTPNAYRCAAGGLEQCNASGIAFEVVAGGVECDGAARVSCGANGVVRNTCLSAAHCAQGTGASCAACVADGECMDNLACNGLESCSVTTRACTPGTAVACLSGQVCSEPLGACVQCVAAADCSPGQVCVDGLCTAPSEGGGT